MEMMRKGAAGVLALLVVLTAVPAQVLFNLERQAFSPSAYQRAFANDDFYGRLPSILAESLQPAIPTVLQGLDEQDWEQFFRDLLPSNVLRAMGDDALASILSYLNGDGSSAILSLAPLKERLASEAGTQAALNLIKTQPACTAEELARISLALLTNQVISLCNPPEDLIPFVLPAVHGQMQIISAAIPMTVTLAQADPTGGKGDARDKIRIARLTMRMTPVIPLTLLLLLTLLLVRSPRDLLLVWGAAMAAAGALGAVFAWLGAPLAGTLLERFLVAKAPDFLPQVLLSNASGLAAAIVDQLLKPTLLQGLMMVLMGGLMLGIAALWDYLRRFRQNPSH